MWLVFTFDFNLNWTNEFIISIQVLIFRFEALFVFFLIVIQYMLLSIRSQIAVEVCLKFKRKKQIFEF